MPTGSSQGSIAAGTYTMVMYFQAIPGGAKSMSYYAEVGYANPDGTGYTTLVQSPNQTVNVSTPKNTAVSFTIGTTTSATYFDPASPKRLRLQIHYVSGDNGTKFYGNNATYPTNLNTPSIVVPEALEVIIVVAVVATGFVLWRRRRQRRARSEKRGVRSERGEAKGEKPVARSGKQEARRLSPLSPIGRQGAEFRLQRRQRHSRQPAES